MIASECPELGQLERLLLGKLGNVESEVLSEHLLHCQTCLARARSIESKDELTKALAANPIADMQCDALRSVISKSEHLVGPVGKSDSTVRRNAKSLATAEANVNGVDVAGQSDNFGANDPGNAAFHGIDPSNYPEVPGFKILGTLGIGGMGVVYRAQQTSLNRIVALKMIRAHALFDPNAMTRFQVEAQSIARLTHPNIVSIYEVGESKRHPFVALEYVAGGSLAEWISRTTVTSKAAAELVAELAVAIQYAHDQGVIHRDLKPANVLLCPTSGVSKFESIAQTSGLLKANVVPERPEASPCDSHKTNIFPMYGNGKSAERIGSEPFEQIRLTPKITDFGLARITNLDDRQTRSGTVIGTPAYMAPEQAQGDPQPSETSADIYSLGAILYELLTGRAPFRAQTSVETLRQVIDQEVAHPRVLNSDIPKDLETICLKCLQKQPSARYPSAADLAADLRRYLDGQPVHARPLSASVRLARWCRRRPAVTALIGTTGLLLITMAVGSTLFAVRVSRLNQAAIMSKQDSDNDRAVAVSAITELSNALYRDLSRRSGTIKEREQLINVALSGLQQVTQNETRIADSSAIFAHLTTAELQGLQGDLAAASESLDRAYGLATELVQTFPDHPSHAYALAQVHAGKASLALAESGTERAIPDIERATEILQRLIEQSPDNPKLLHSLLRVRRQMVSVYIVRQDAESVYRECTLYLPMAERFHELAEDEQGREVLGEVQRLLHYSALQMGKNSTAKGHGQSAVTHFKELKQAAPDDTVTATSYWQAIQTRAMEHAANGLHTEASRDMDAAIRGYRELAQRNPEDLEFQYVLADALRWNCYQGCWTYNTAKVKESGYESIKLLRELIRKSPSNHRYKATFVASSGHVAEIARGECDWQELDARLEEAVEIYRTLDPGTIDMQFEGSYGTVFENVWEATRRHFQTFDGKPSPDGTCALLLTYAFMESIHGRKELSKEAQANIVRTCELELTDQDDLFTAVNRIKGRSAFWIGSTLIHEAVVHGNLAENADDQASRSDHLARSVAAIKRVKQRHPEIAAIRLPVTMELQWVRQTKLYQQEIGDQ